MVKIEAREVSLSYPVYDSVSRSLKKKLVCAATGGRIANDSSGTCIRALEDISFLFKKGDRVGLIGHNGAGKSTLLKVIAGVYRPSSGSLAVKGTIASLLDLSLRMDGEFTGYENIIMRSILMGISMDVIKKSIDDIIEFSELGEYINMPMRIYSSGMLLRLAFSTCTAFHADIILMDEWLSVGDAEFSKKAEDRLMKYINKASILVMASHSIELVNKMCNRILHMEHGKMSEV